MRQDGTTEGEDEAGGFRGRRGGELKLKLEVCDKRANRGKTSTSTATLLFCFLVAGRQSQAVVWRIPRSRAGRSGIGRLGE